MTGDRPTTPGWHCHRCRSTSCRQRGDSDTDHVGRVEYRPLLLTQSSSVSCLWSHTHWCPSQRPQEVMRVDGSANPTMPKNPAQYKGVSCRRVCVERSFRTRPPGGLGARAARMMYLIRTPPLALLVFRAKPARSRRGVSASRRGIMRSRGRPTARASCRWTQPRCPSSRSGADAPRATTSQLFSAAENGASRM